ncbi:MAG TPA: response regulator, partial [Usitatibacter sp.]
MTTSHHILHVEDSPDDSELVRLSLRKAPFAHSYDRVETEADYVAQLDRATPDVILCDYELPHFSAERALQIMHERGLDVPFIIVSNHVDESTAVIAMQQGASDYLPKRNLGRLPKAIASAIDHSNARAEKARAQEELRASESMKRSILNSLTSRIATIDGEGVILSMNKAWTDFRNMRTQIGFRAAGVEDNYFDLLKTLAEGGSGVAQAIYDGIREVIARERTFFSLEYYLDIGSARHWYLASAVPLEGSEHGAVVSHR